MNSNTTVPLIPHGIYQHYRNKKLYRVIGRALDHSHDDMPVVVYEPVDNTTVMYTRTVDEFFETVTNEDGAQVYRFAHLFTETDNGLSK